MGEITQRIKNTSQSPYIGLLGEDIAHVKINELRGPIHLSGFFCNYFFRSLPFLYISNMNKSLDTRTEITESNFSILQKDKATYYNNCNENCTQNY